MAIGPGRLGTARARARHGPIVPGQESTAGRRAVPRACFVPHHRPRHGPSRGRAGPMARRAGSVPREYRSRATASSSRVGGSAPPSPVVVAAHATASLRVRQGYATARPPPRESGEAAPCRRFAGPQPRAWPYLEKGSASRLRSRAEQEKELRERERETRTVWTSGRNELPMRLNAL